MVPMSSGHTLQTADFDPEDMVACYQERELFRPLRRGEWLNRSPLSAKPHCRALGALSDSPERGEGLLSGHGFGRYRRSFIGRLRFRVLVLSANSLANREISSESGRILRLSANSDLRCPRLLKRFYRLHPRTVNFFARNREIGSATETTSPREPTSDPRIKPPSDERHAGRAVANHYHRVRTNGFSNSAVGIAQS